MASARTVARVAPARRAWSKMSGMDTTAIEQFQMHGQDIPWLLEHWAEHKPDHPALVWAPREGDEPALDLRRAARPTYAGSPPGCAARGIAKGDKVLIHSENCPEMVLSWLACATLGAVAVTTNTKSVGAEVTYFAEHTGARRRDHPAAVRGDGRRRRAGAEVDRGHRRQQRRAGGPPTQSAHGFDRLRRAVRRRRRLDDRAHRSRCSRSASCSRRARRAGPRRSCTRTPTRSGRAGSGRATSTSTTDDTLPDLPAVLPRERAELVASSRCSASARPRC